MSELHNHKSDFEKSLQQAFDGYTSRADDGVWEGIRQHTSGFEKQVQVAFSEYSIHADDFVWSNILDALGDKNRRRFVWWYWAGAAAIAGLLIFSVLPFNKTQEAKLANNNLNKNEQLTVQPVEKDSVPTGDKQNLIENELASSSIEEESGESYSSMQGAQNNALAANEIISNQLAETSPNTKQNVLVADKYDSSERVKKMQLINTSVYTKIPQTFLTEEGVTDYLLPKYTERAATEEENQTDVNQLALAAHFTSSSMQQGVGAQAQELTADSWTANTSFDSGNRDITQHPALTFGVSFTKPISSRWELESGISYTLLASTSISNQGQVKTNTRNSLHYIGLPAIINFTIVNKRRFNLYSSQGLLTEKSILNSYSTTTTENGLLLIEQSNSTYYPGWQFGALAGIGINYSFNKRLSIYMQPSASFWFLNINHFRNSRNSSLVTPNLRAGIRIGL